MPKLGPVFLALVLTVSVAVAQSFTFTGAMATPRIGAAAVLLANGQVLIAGGQSLYPQNGQSGQPLASAELYDTARGSFVATGSMTVARANPSAVLLTSGNALVVDGNGADIYQAASGSFVAVGTLPQPLQAATAVQLSDGRVMVTGATPNCNPGQCTDPVEIYDPSSGKFTVDGSLLVARENFSVALLTGGNVLIVGGGDTNSMSTTPSASAEIYDPVSGVSTMSAGSSFPVEKAAAVRLANGEVLICGGDSHGYSALAQAELYDPARDSFTATGSMNVGRNGHAIALLADGTVLVAGGFTQGGAILNSAELYNPALATFAVTGEMNAARELFPATLLANGDVLVAGGMGAGDSLPALASAELFQPPAATSDFSLTTTQPMVTVTGGDIATFAVAGNGAGGFSGAIQLSCQNTGSATCAFQPAQISSGQVSTLTVANLSPAAGGVLQFLAEGVSGSETHSLALEATFVPPALVPSGLSFGKQTVGTTSGPQTLTLSNGGQSSMRIAAIASGGDFQQTNNCPASLAPASSCTVNVIFVPSVAGSRTGNLSFTDDAALSPQIAVIEGTATDVSVQPAPGAAASATVQPGQTANYSIAVTPLGGYTGSVALTCGGAPAGATCTASPSTLTLSSSSAATATVTVTTAATNTGGVPPSVGTFLWWLIALGMFLTARRRRMVWVAPVALALLLAGCGANSSSKPAATIANSGTTAGAYTLTVTASGAGIQRATQLTLTVQ